MQNCYYQKRRIYLNTHHKPFGGWALPGPPGGAYSATTDPLAGPRVWGSQEGRQMKCYERRKGLREMRVMKR